MPLSKVLRSRNLDGEPYLCDIEEWLGTEIPSDKLMELQERLAEIKYV